MSVPIRIIPTERPAEAAGLIPVRELAAQLIVRLKRDNLALDDLRDALELNEARDLGRSERMPIFRPPTFSLPPLPTDPVLPPF